MEEEIKQLMEDHDLREETAEEVGDIIEELGVDEDDAIEIQESL